MDPISKSLLIYLLLGGIINWFLFYIIGKSSKKLAHPILSSFTTILIWPAIVIIVGIRIYHEYCFRKAKAELLDSLDQIFNKKSSKEED